MISALYTTPGAEEAQPNGNHGYPKTDVGWTAVNALPPPPKNQKENFFFLNVAVIAFTLVFFTRAQRRSTRRNPHRSVRKSSRRGGAGGCHPGFRNSLLRPPARPAPPQGGQRHPRVLQRWGYFCQKTFKDSRLLAWYS